MVSIAIDNQYVKTLNKNAEEISKKDYLNKSYSKENVDYNLPKSKNNKTQKIKKSKIKEEEKDENKRAKIHEKCSLVIKTNSHVIENIATNGMLNNKESIKPILKTKNKENNTKIAKPTKSVCFIDQISKSQQNSEEAIQKGFSTPLATIINVPSFKTYEIYMREEDFGYRKNRKQNNSNCSIF